MPVTTIMLTNAIVTAYCACAVCCGPKSSPRLRGITADGSRAQQGITIAASRAIPLGSRVTIGRTTFVVQDRLARRFDGRFDVFFTRHEDAKKFGKQRLNVTIDIAPTTTTR